MTAAGFYRVSGASDRVQLWAGPNPSDPTTTVMAAWDATTGRRKIIPESADFLRLYLTLLGIVLAIADLVDLTSFSTAQKNGIKQQLLASIKDD